MITIFILYYHKGGDKWVVKAQILAGGRGLGHFDNGFQGGVHICKRYNEISNN